MPTDNALAETIEQLNAAPAAKPVRGVPRRVTVTLIALAVGGTAWLAWSAWNAAGGRQVVVLSRDPDGVVERLGPSWVIRSGRGKLTVTPAADGGAEKRDWSRATCEFAFDAGDAATPEQQQLLELVSNLLARKEENAAYLGLTGEQVRALEQIEAARKEAVGLTPGEQRRIGSLVAEHEKRVVAADNGAATANALPTLAQSARDKLCEAVEALARDKIPAARRVSAARAGEVPKALTESQWVKYRGGVPTDQPTTRPKRRGRPG